VTVWLTSATGSQLKPKSQHVMLSGLGMICCGVKGKTNVTLGLLSP
jgi:hypothetical protein